MTEVWKTGVWSKISIKPGKNRERKKGRRSRGRGPF
jgi:hypothetical protein